MSDDINNKLSIHNNKKNRYNAFKQSFLKKHRFYTNLTNELLKRDKKTRKR